MFICTELLDDLDLGGHTLGRQLERLRAKSDHDAVLTGALAVGLEAAQDNVFANRRATAAPT